MINPRRTGTVITSYLPNLEKKTGLGYETILSKDRYISRLRFPNSIRPSRLDTLFPSTYQIEPKPGKKISTDLYYKEGGEFNLGENYGKGGDLPITDSILDLKDSSEHKETEAEVVAKLEDIVCTPDSPGDGDNGAHRASLLRENIPYHLKHRRTRIIKEIESTYAGYLALNVKPAGEDRFLIVITGRPGTQKTKLSKLIISRLDKNDIIANSKGFAMGKEQDLTDKLPRMGSKEVVILDDYSGRNHNHGILDRLTCEDLTELRVMGDYETNRYIKGVIIPSPHPIEKWVTGNTASLDTLEQEIRRAECNLYLFPHLSPSVKHPSWEDYQDRLFYVGNVRRGIYKTLIDNNPDLLYEPLGRHNRDTELARDLAKLFHKVCNSLYKEKKYGGEAFERSQVPERFGSYQPETHLGAKPGIIRAFTLPSYEGLREKINSLGSDELGLDSKSPKNEECPILSPQPVSSPNLKSEPKLCSLDIETGVAGDSPLKALMLKTLQLNDEFIKVTPENKPKLIEKLKDKEFIVFNSPPAGEPKGPSGPRGQGLLNKLSFIGMDSISELTNEGTFLY